MPNRISQKTSIQTIYQKEVTSESKRKYPSLLSILITVVMVLFYRFVLREDISARGFCGAATGQWPSVPHALAPRSTLFGKKPSSDTQQPSGVMYLIITRDYESFRDGVGWRGGTFGVGWKRFPRVEEFGGVSEAWVEVFRVRMEFRLFETFPGREKNCIII